MLIKHKEKCEQKQEITTIRTSVQSRLFWENRFQKNPIFFRTMADFEADNEIENSNLGDKTTKLYKQIPVLNGYYFTSELNDISKSG